MSRFLILGGCGFVGRHVVSYLVQNKLASKIVVADKVLPEVAGLSSTELAMYQSEPVSFKQANLAREATIGKVFEHEGGNFDYVINVAAATKYSQASELYQENIVEVAKTCATASVQYKVKRFVHVSTAQVYDADKKASTETSKVKPWTGLAKASRTAEETVAGINGLDYVIVRPAIIYGTGDVNGITPRIIIGAVYQKMEEKMELLWSKELRLNTVHVDDVAKALVLLTTKGEKGAIYNLADSGDSDQKSVSKLVEEAFGIKTEYMGDIKSKIATAISMKTVCEVANEKHLKPWSELLKEHKIVDSPLTPYLDEELLYNNSTSVDGTKITGIGFTYDHPSLTIAHIKEVVSDFEAKGYFPKGLLKC